VTLFDGLDAVPWARLKHAYGSAGEVPELLRGLVDPDPAERELALDAMYGSVHHQGDVYRCTLETIPFLLRIVGRPELPGRAEVVELLSSIGGADHAEDPAAKHYRAANEAVAAASGLLKTLLEDDDAAVRTVAPRVLLTARRRGGEMAGALRQRFTAEPDVATRKAIVRAMAELGRRGVDVESWLADVLAGPDDAGVRLTALAALDGVAVDVPTALELFGALYAIGAPSAAPAGFVTDTLIGAQRRRVEADAEGRRAPKAAELVRRVSASLGDRVDDRIQLLAALLRSPDWEQRIDALVPASNLIQGWRGRYDELVALVGEQLVDERLAGPAARVLECLGELARPAADALATALHHAGPASWVIEWPSGLPTIAPAVRALAGTGDPRAVPMLRWALERDRLPRDAAHLATSPELAPVLAHRLQILSVADERYDSVAVALIRLGVLPDLPELAFSSYVVEALGSLGPAASGVLPRLRECAGSDHRATAVAAARALWLVGGDAEPALAVFDRHLAGDEWAVRDAVAGYALLGPAAAARADRLRKLLRRKDVWLSLGAAQALWRVAGDTTATLPVLERAWLANKYTRRTVAATWTEMGPVAAASALPLLETELASVRRHSVIEHGWRSAQARDDEDLLRSGRAAISAMSA
jgi:hypothetical protein